MVLALSGDTAGFEGLQRGADRFGIDLAHELADILQLAFAPTALAYLLGRENGFVQVNGQGYFIQLVRPETDQLFSHRLQSVGFALALAFTGAVVEVIVSAHGRIATFVESSQMVTRLPAPANTQRIR